MWCKTVQTFIMLIIISAMAFEDPFLVYGQVSEEAVEEGRNQYQLLKERGTLPRYGNCWRSAIEIVEEGCRYLTEDTQVDVALYLSNCFLAMSGHETYNCLQDRKPNLRAICINSMSDRAFNVYTKFYTHTQNMCWFLRGQFWQEMIAENAVKVGKQLATSAENQEEILAKQRQSIDIQRQLMESGRTLQEVMDRFYISTQEHHEILTVMSRSLQGLQSWLIGEVSWVNSLVFYISTFFLVGILTSSQRTGNARLPILILLLCNCLLERGVYAVWIYYNSTMEAHRLHAEVEVYVWWLRRSFLLFSTGIFLYAAYTFCDIDKENNRLLKEICQQNTTIINYLNGNRDTNLNGSVSFVREKSVQKLTNESFNSNQNNNFKHEDDVPVHHQYTSTIGRRKALTPIRDVENGYNLRSRQGTPQTII